MQLTESVHVIYIQNGHLVLSSSQSYPALAGGKIELLGSAWAREMENKIKEIYVEC
jgi:hypothetical protein